ncbi:SAF domain-containing protein [Nocardioides acrostichi]|uniref:SAF domain-containing protein n=1 Tax=Nocardioides acrostichi TaxID=2784339 RepID=A0A930YAU8_9ACTN|nr:SAF domain-containing protein [Nocardioides acrostichi]MBF4161768.1 hypothetical protein [Nocardioides acrostichi]
MTVQSSAPTRSAGGRAGATAAPRRDVPPPSRQRRPALAALAVVLIVGGALGAGLLAVRMDSRTPVLAAARDIAPGTLITADDLRQVDVASDGLRLIPADLASQILDGATYAEVPIKADSLVDQNMLTRQAPLDDGNAIVSVPLDPKITPQGSLQGGDLVQVVQIAGEQGGDPVALTEGLVVDVAAASSGDDLSAPSGGSVTILVPKEAAPAVVNAAGSDQAGLVLIARGQSTDTKLKVLS